MNLENYLNRQSKRIEAALERFLPKEKQYPAPLSEAMRYAVLSGGKRIRPIFALAASEAVGGKEEDVMAAACALELVHCYSLVHDDLPCMDNDLLRRGKPSCHAKFGEVTALLAGDALLTRAFGILGSMNGSKKSSEKMKLLAIQWIADAIGHQGMVGGQALDMEYQDKEMDLPTVEFINMHKSGALIAVSTRVGAFLGGGSDSQVKCLHQYGKAVGLLFQLTDDIMDDQGYAKVIGSQEAHEESARLLKKAKQALLPLRSKGRTCLAGRQALEEIADFIATRKN